MKTTKTVGRMPVPIFAIWLAFFFVGCEADRALQDEDILSAEQAEMIATSPEATAVYALYSESIDLIHAALDRGVPATLLQDMYLENDPSFGDVVFGTAEAARAWESRRVEALERLTRAFPVLLKLAEDDAASCSAADQASVERFFSRLEHRHSGSSQAISSSLMGDVEDVPTCGSYWQQAKLLACSAAASFCGPTAILCGWGCWCMLCSDNSAVADAIC